MTTRYLSLLFFFLTLFLSTACRHDSQTGRILNQADSLLATRPDSALHLLEQHADRLPPRSTRECARYALLLARALDKCEQPLEPCDSLLDAALACYDSRSPERATALLYKARLEVEMDCPERAIAHLQEGLEILRHFPEAEEIRRHTLSSLGNLYFENSHYEDARKMHLALWPLCHTDKDKAIALNALSDYPVVQESGDSAVDIQRRALRYALASGDSGVIAMSEYNLSLRFYLNDDIDSAIHYARRSLANTPHGQDRGQRYSLLGSLYAEQGIHPDSALHYLQQSLTGTSFSDLAAYLNLYEVEKERGNCPQALHYLEKHADIVDSLFIAERNSGINRTIYEYKTRLRVQEAEARNREHRNRIVLAAVVCCALLALLCQHLYQKKRRQKLVYESILQELEQRQHTLQQEIDRNQEALDRLQQEKTDQQADQVQQTQHLRQTIDRLKAEKLQLQHQQFRGTRIYKKIHALTRQDTADRKAWKVLSPDERTELRRTVDGIYADYIAHLQTLFPPDRGRPPVLLPGCGGARHTDHRALLRLHRHPHHQPAKIAAEGPIYRPESVKCDSSRKMHIDLQTVSFLKCDSLSLDFAV